MNRSSTSADKFFSIPRRVGWRGQRPFRCQTTIVGNQAVIRIAGEVDIATRDQVRSAGLAALAHVPGGHLDLNLRDVTFLDASGLGAMVAVSNAATRQRVLLRLVDVSARVRFLLTLTALDKIFTTASTYPVDTTGVRQIAMTGRQGQRRIGGA